MSFESIDSVCECLSSTGADTGSGGSVFHLKKAMSGLSPGEVWTLCEDTVRRRARSELRRHFVTGPDGRVDEAAEDDVCQSVAMKLLAAIKSGQYCPEKSGSGGLLGYASQIARNEVITYARTYRSAGRKSEVLSDDGTILGQLAEPEAEGWRATTAWREGTLRSEVLQRVNDLPPSVRELVLLRYEHGMARKAISEQLGVALSTVHNRLVTAIALLEQIEWGELRL